MPRFYITEVKYPAGVSYRVELNRPPGGTSASIGTVFSEDMGSLVIKLQRTTHIAAGKLARKLANAKA